MKLANKIEAILFFKGEPVSVKQLTLVLKVSAEEIRGAIEELKSAYTGRGFVLIEKEDEYMFGTAPELSGMFEELQKEELNKTLTKSSLETLSIILYKNGASRAEIDYIRGVNSSFTLRALSVRGLIEKVTDKMDSRRYLYQPTFELLSYMGLGSVRDLPDFNNIEQKISNLIELEKESKTEDVTE